MTREESRKFNAEREKKMTGAERVRDTIMNDFGFGARSYKSLPEKMKDKVDREVKRLVQDIYGEETT